MVYHLHIAEILNILVRVHDHQNSHWCPSTNLHVDDVSLLSQQWLWPYCKLKMLRLSTLNSLATIMWIQSVLYSSAALYSLWAGASLCSAILSRRRVARQFVPHMHIEVLSHVCTQPHSTFQFSHRNLLLSVTAVLIRLFRCNSLYLSV